MPAGLHIGKPHHDQAGQKPGHCHGNPGPVPVQEHADIPAGGRIPDQAGRHGPSEIDMGDPQFPVHRREEKSQIDPPDAGGNHAYHPKPESRYTIRKKYQAFWRRVVLLSMFFSSVLDRAIIP